MLLKNNIIKTQATDIQTQPSNYSNDEMAGQHRPLNGHEPEPTPGDSEGQGSLAGCSPRGRRVRRDLATEQPGQQSTPRSPSRMNPWTTATDSRGKYRHLSNTENGERS